MPITLPLQEMTVEEKLELMEAIWADLSRHGEAISAPGWHGGVLAERKTAVENGEATFEDWEAARRRIEKEIK